MRLLCASVASMLLLVTAAYAVDNNAYRFSVKTAHNEIISASMQHAGLSVCGNNVLLHIPDTQTISPHHLHNALPVLGQAVAERCPSVQRIVWEFGASTGTLHRQHHWQAHADNQRETRSTAQLIAENRLTHYLALSDSLTQSPELRWRTLNQDLNKTEYLRLLRGQIPTLKMSRVMRLERQNDSLWLARWPYPAHINAENTHAPHSADGLFYVSGQVQLSPIEHDEDGLFLTLIHADRLEPCRDEMCSNLDLALIVVREQLNDPTWEPEADRQLAQIAPASPYAGQPD